MHAPPLIIAHRCNTLNWIRRHARCSNGFEVDVIAKDGALYTTHSLLSNEPPGLLRERLARLITEWHLRPPSRLEYIIRSIPKEKIVVLDPKSVEAIVQLADLPKSLLEQRRIYVATRWHKYAAFIESLGLKSLLSIECKPSRPSKLVEESGASGIAISAAFVDEELVRELKHRNMLVAVWTVNSVSRIMLLARLSVDFIITDKPCIARSVVKGGGLSGSEL